VVRDAMSADVSVVIATNRDSPYLRHAIASVQGQTIAVAEIVVVDDGSPVPDRVEQVATDLAVRYLRQAPAGVSAARNRGAAATTGEWLAFLDDDDEWHPEKLAEQLAAIDSRPDAVACGTGHWIMDGDGAPTGVVAEFVAADRTEMLRGTAPLPHILTMLVRRDAFELVGGFDPCFPHAQDIEFTLRLLQLGQFAAAPRALAGYRRHAGNRSGGLHSAEAFLRALRAQLAWAEHHGDEATPALIRQNIAGFRRATAEWVSASTLTDLRRGRLGESIGSAAWGLRRIPREYLAATTRRATAWARR